MPSSSCCSWARRARAGCRGASARRAAIRHAASHASHWRAAVEVQHGVHLPPHNVLGTRDCLERVRRRRGVTAGVCAIARATALRRDPAVVAAASLRSARVRDVFSTTLGPYLLRHAERALR